jgi:hypothetical protein
MWNTNIVTRNSNDPTADWNIVRLLLFGMLLIKKAAPEVITQMNG